ncbi:hypothetical protein C0J52_00203 [Blattella germanica]|nr:hypothetical protein C0J52_00203 [Blattella germanica]
MEGNYSFSSYHNGGPGREKDFQKLAQTIGTSIQKISQNGTNILHINCILSNIFEFAFVQVLEPLLKKKETLDDRQWKMQKERLADGFTTALNTFQATQRRAAQKEKEQVQRVRANSGLGDPFGGGRYSEQLIELQDNSGQLDAQMQDEMNLQMLEQQEQAIRQLESDISDVNQIFKDLGAMVHDQGEVIDSIEASVEKTEVFVGEGTNQLRQASNYQTKLRKKKCILAVCLAVVLAVIIGIIAWQASHSNLANRAPQKEGHNARDSEYNMCSDHSNHLDQAVDLTSQERPLAPGNGYKNKLLTCNFKQNTC